MSSGSAAAAASDASDTYRQNPTTTAKIATAHAIESGDKYKNIPAAVATPFPPWNPSQIGKQWPISAASAAIIIQVALSCVSRAAIHTATVPLPASKSSVSTPAVGPATRATFV